MLKDIYAKDIQGLSLLNEGVVTVNDNRDEAALQVLEFEVRTFVCQGHYEKGLRQILESFLTNLQGNREQKAVWISGFFGSGKSHLAKMLRTLWINQTFTSGQKALELVHLPQDIQALFKELDREGRKVGGVHSLSGTLKSGASDRVRLTTLGFLFQSLGLPEKVNQARFCLWLREEGVLEKVQVAVERLGKRWAHVVGNFFVAQDLHQAVANALPNHFRGPEDVQDRLKEQFRLVEDVSNQELVELFRLALTTNGQFPLTLVVLDEVQQFIGQNDGLSMAVQELVETLSKAFHGRILFIGTGQNALAGTSHLQKLMGRFPVPVNLSDSDVDTVVRENILKKKPSAEAELKAMMVLHQGEIDRHLTGTPLAPQQHRDDATWLVPDYPVLPVRRRFWDKALKAADLTGTAYQLRNQLRMIFNAVKESQEQPLGFVVPGDYLYEQNSTAFVETAVLSRELMAQIDTFKASSDENEKLKGRILSLCFLLGKVNTNNPTDVIPCIAKTLEDLLISDLKQAETLRQKVGALCDELVREGHLLKTADNGFAVQTKEGQRWTLEFRRFVADLNHKPEDVNQLRREKLNTFADARLGNVKILHGTSRVERPFPKAYTTAEPAKGDPVIWVRNGWEVDEVAALREARAVGNESPWIVVFVPQKSENDVKRYLIDAKAADRTLASLGAGSGGPEAEQAMASIMATRKTAEEKLTELWEDLIHEAKVWLGGGQEISSGLDVTGRVEDAAGRILERIYPEFSKGDSPRWADALSEAQNGSVHGLSKMGHTGEVESHVVCAEILRRTQTAILWSDLRAVFLRPPFGWPKDTIEGALYTLWINGVITVKRSGGKDLSPGDVQRKDVGTLYVSSQAVHLTTNDRLKLRALYQELGLIVTQGQELERVGEFFKMVMALRQESGGQAPWPEPARPDWFVVLEDLSGNTLSKALAEQKDTIAADLKVWLALKAKITQRKTDWDQLTQLVALAATLEEAVPVQQEIDAIRSNRSILQDPDPVPALKHRLVDVLHAGVTEAWNSYSEAFKRGQQTLASDSLWERLPTQEQYEIKNRNGFTPIEQPKTAQVEQLIEALRASPLSFWKDRALAINSRVSQILRDAAVRLEPAVTTVALPRPPQAMKTEQDIDLWLGKVRSQLTEALKKGPILPQ